MYELPKWSSPDRPGPLVFKEYRRPHGEPARLRTIVAVRGALDLQRRDRLDSLAAWPCRVVEDGGEVVGIVMPRIPARYTAEISLPGSNTVARHAREVQNLFIDPGRMARLGHEVPSMRARIALCRDMAAALAFFHDELEVVFGDINHANELYRLEPTGVFFIDCDGVRPRGVVARHSQLNSPDWIPPEPGPLTRATDLYKYGLFVLRCLLPGADASNNTDPAPAAAVLDAVGMDLLTRALHANPAVRPSARDWRRHLNALLGEPEEPPVITAASLGRDHVLRGQPVEVAWAAEHATTVEVRSGGFAVRVDGKAGRGTVLADVERSGFVQVHAHNELGVDVKVIGPVAVVQPPETAWLPAPLPSLVFPHVGLPVPPMFVPVPPAPVPAPALAADVARAAGPLRLTVPLAASMTPEDVIGAGPVLTFDTEGAA
ncbi:hypothetical protein [Actinokineospora fastidiosa]|uniref:hypothetical protein n=1 Tax=Actinokineospora fastidiosa TaxID=1816 RepID=UPI001671224D|nr:hypothetical protein [Actinokineospora fastidiosa]